MTPTVTLDVLGLIPARGGSKGIPRKNLIEVGGKPLLAWTLEAARGAAELTRVVVSTDDDEIAAAAGVEVLPVALTLEFREGGACAVVLDGVEPGRCFDTIYPVLGASAQSQLAAALGARVDRAGELVVDAKQDTSVDGLYAIGDVVSGLHQISVAMGLAAIAASAIHQRLAPNFREDEASQPETAPELPSPNRP